MNKILEIVKEILMPFAKNWMVRVIILTIILFAAVFCGCQSTWFEERFGIPDWTLEKKIGMDAISTEQSLKTGTVNVCPLLIIECNGEVVNIVRLLNYYESTKVCLADDKNQFLLQLEEEQREKVRVIEQELKRLLEEKTNSSFDWNIEQVIVSTITYQNPKANSSDPQFYFFSDKEERRISEKQAWNYEPLYDLDIDNIMIDSGLEAEGRINEILDGCISNET